MRAAPLLFALLTGCAATSPQAIPHTPGNISSQAGTGAAAPAVIAEFQGDYRFLSNFWPATIEFEGITYPTVEHAYQAAKSLDAAERRRIAALPTPADAKREGRLLTLRPDWDEAKFTVMERCIREKFERHADLRTKLLATGEATLEEGNTWGDRVWGIYQGQGDNRLGRILMAVRAELASQAAPTPHP